MKVLTSIVRPWWCIVVEEPRPAFLKNDVADVGTIGSGPIELRRLPLQIVVCPTQKIEVIDVPLVVLSHAQAAQSSQVRLHPSGGGNDLRDEVACKS